jgi:hypothetical protein
MTITRLSLFHPILLYSQDRREQVEDPMESPSLKIRNPCDTVYVLKERSTIKKEKHCEKKHPISLRVHGSIHERLVHKIKPRLQEGRQ